MRPSTTPFGPFHADEDGTDTNPPPPPKDPVVRREEVKPSEGEC